MTQVRQELARELGSFRDLFFVTLEVAQAMGITE